MKLTKDWTNVYVFMQLLLESPQTFKPYSTTQLIFTNSKKTYLFEGDKN